MHVYSPNGFPSYPYYHSKDYTFLPENVNFDSELTKLLCIIKKELDPLSVGYNTEYMKMIPHLIKCKILRKEKGKPILNIPVINTEEAKKLWHIACDTRYNMVADLKEILKDFFIRKKQHLQSHLNRVPLQKQYLCADNTFTGITKT